MNKFGQTKLHDLLDTYEIAKFLKNKREKKYKIHLNITKKWLDDCKQCYRIVYICTCLHTHVRRYIYNTKSYNILTSQI